VLERLLDGRVTESGRHRDEGGAGALDCDQVSDREGPAGYAPRREPNRGSVRKVE